MRYGGKFRCLSSSQTFRSLPLNATGCRFAGRLYWSRRKTSARLAGKFMSLISEQHSQASSSTHRLVEGVCAHECSGCGRSREDVEYYLGAVQGAGSQLIILRKY
eukprot:1002381-Amorphochlora_amoeboformis.AAC.5